jgi:hypothetical protein
MTPRTRTPIDGTWLDAARHIPNREDNAESRLDKLLQKTLDGGAIEVPLEVPPMPLKALRRLVSRIAKVHQAKGRVHADTDRGTIRMWLDPLEPEDLVSEPEPAGELVGAPDA